jgi:NitT/TauT family transport system substrate-binding protein
VAKLKIIASGFALGSHVNEIMARADSPVKSLASLKGKTIAVNAVNSEVTDLLYNALAADHITPGQVHLTQIPFPAMAAALATGRVDAAYMTEPYVTEAGQRNGDVGIYDLDTGPALNFPIAG